MEQLQTFFNTIIIPAVIAAGSYLIVKLKKYAQKYMDSIEVKHELENMAKRTEIKNTLLNEIKTIVDSVVGSNMQLADSMKEENGGHLTDDQSRNIKKIVQDVVTASLPDSLTNKDGVLLEVIGGEERLNTIVGNMIDKAVYDYKLKKK